MANQAANEQELGTLHKLLTDKYLKLVQTTDDPRLLTAIAKFLKDNDITAVPVDGSGINDLKKELEKRSRRFGDLAKEAEEAARSSIH